VKVLHVAPSLSRAYGGPTYSLAAFARAALDSGAELTIAAPAPTSPDSWLASALPEVEIRTFRTFGRDAFLASPALQSWLRASGRRFDVVHVHGLLNPVSSLAARTCVRKRWPVVIRPFGTMSRYTFAHRRGALKRLYRALLDRPNLERASAVHFTTAMERAESAWQGIEWGARAYVIPPPWLEGAAPADVRKSSDAGTVLFFSRLHPVKRVELLLDAWAGIQRRVPNARLVIAGDGAPAYVRELRAHAERVGAAVTFAGFVEGDAKRELLGSADVFVLPSLHENFGIAVLEALAAGLPVVITPEVQLSGFVREHALGIVAEGNAGALAESVAAALDDSVLRKRCRTQGAALVSRYFSPSAIGEQLLDMYRFANEHPPA
jgi:glycosyltransferase involved in cell wall biosynthesis